MVALPSVIETRPSSDGEAMVPRSRQIHVSRQLGVGILEVQLRRRLNAHVEPDVIRWRIGRSDRLSLAGLRGQRHKVHLRAHGETRDHHVAAQQKIALRSLQLQIDIGRGTDPLRIADADRSSFQRKVGIDAVLIGQVSGNAQQARRRSWPSAISLRGDSD